MAAKFKIGDHVKWNSEAGLVSGKIIAVHTKDVVRKGYTHHASLDDPQYEIKSDKTDHIALHKDAALKKRTSKQLSENHRSDQSSGVHRPQAEHKSFLAIPA